MGTIGKKVGKYGAELLFLFHDDDRVYRYLGSAKMMGLTKWHIYDVVALRCIYNRQRHVDRISVLKDHGDPKGTAKRGRQPKNNTDANGDF